MYIKTLKIIPTRNTFKVATKNSYSAFLRSLLYLLKYINISSFIIMFSLSACFVHELCTQKSTQDSAYLRQQLSYTTARPPLAVHPENFFQLRLKRTMHARGLDCIDFSAKISHLHANPVCFRCSVPTQLPTLLKRSVTFITLF